MHGNFSVGFFDVRHAVKAQNELPLTHPDLFAEIFPDLAASPCRCVKVEPSSASTSDRGLQLDAVTSKLALFGSIERVGYGANHREIVVEFSDSRACDAACLASSASVENIHSSASLNRSPSPHHQAAVALPDSAPPSGFSGGVGMFEIDAELIRAGKDTRTTCMMRNIPNKYSQRMLLKLIDSEGFAESYDFFYLPVDLRQKANCGFAFISFVESETVIRFMEAFDGKRWDKFNSNKICKITFARLQGKHMLMEHFRSSSIMQQGKHVRPYFREDLGPALAPSLLEELHNWLNAQAAASNASDTCESALFSDTSSNPGFGPSSLPASDWAHLGLGNQDPNADWSHLRNFQADQQFSSF